MCAEALIAPAAPSASSAGMRKQSPASTLKPGGKSAIISAVSRSTAPGECFTPTTARRLAMRRMAGQLTRCPVRAGML